VTSELYVDLDAKVFDQVLLKRKMFFVVKEPPKIGCQTIIRELDELGKQTGRVVIAWVSYMEHYADTTIVGIVDTPSW
jgi:hypothetical protein